MKYITNKDLLYKTGNYIQYPITRCSGKESEKEYPYLGIGTLFGLFFLTV